MIIPMLCVTIFVILVVWFLLPRVARLMIHTPTAISIFVCLSMVQLMAVFISMRCTLCGHFLQVARSEERRVGKERRTRRRASVRQNHDIFDRRSSGGPSRRLLGAAATVADAPATSAGPTGVPASSP